MDSKTSESLEKIREQFNNAPYPRVPLEQSPRNNYNLLFKHNLVTPYYLRYQKVITTDDALILDAGCGSGFNSLILAEANPGATIVGIDISEASVKLAEQRLQFHGFNAAKFHTLPIEDIPQLGFSFDYINCDETLYLVPDPATALAAMKAVLKPEGILRFNLHSALQRQHFYRAQTLFKELGLMDKSPDAEAMNSVIETMNLLKDEVRLKVRTWKPEWAEPEHDGQILANHLLMGDKGFTIPDLFNLLEGAGLEFVSMVNWRHWDAVDLFNDPDNLPAIWAMSLEGASVAEKLHLYELLHPASRLFDCWCAHPNGNSSVLPVEQWTDEDWQTAQVHLHPQLRHDQSRNDLINCVDEARSFEISRYVDLPTLGPVMLQSALAACLLPLWEQPQPMMALVERRLQTEAKHPVTLEPVTPDLAFAEVKHLLNQLHAFLYILLER